jgi:GNAT superfamily N-acetyltransferase
MMARWKVKLRTATVDDKEFLFDLARMVYEKLVIDQFGKWVEKSQRNYFEKKWKNANYRIIEKDDNRIGTIWVTTEKDHIQLNEIQLLPEFQWHGIGSALVRKELEKAQEQSKPMRLRPLRNNKAIKFYERLGFVVYDKTEAHFLMTYEHPPRE